MNVSVTTSVNAAARRAMDGATTYREGAEKLLAAARGNPGLMAALLEPHELNAAMDAVQKAISNFRAVVWAVPDREDQANRVGALIKANREMLLDFPLPGGLALRFATKWDVKEAAGFYRDHSNDMAHKSRWLVRIARRVPEGKTVADALDNSTLEKIQEDTRNG